MRNRILAVSILLAGSASAQFSETGVGDFIPAGGVNTGNPAGFDTSNMDHDFTQTDPPGVGSVTVAQPVTSIDSIELTGLDHTWAGDLQIVLTDPNGVGYNIMFRPGLGPGATCCGNGDDLLGDYIWVSPGQSTNGPIPAAASGGGSIAPGTYDQSWDSMAGVVWPEPDENVFNTPMNTITGPAGVWTLSIYDWAALDPGMWASWTLIGNGGGAGPGANYCTSTINSTGGASVMSANGSGSIALNNLTLNANSLPQQPGIFIAGPTQAQVPFFNGFLCVSPSGLQRFSTVNLPTAGVVSESVDYATSAPGGLNVSAGVPYNFQRWNRDPAGGGASANFSDGYTITFAP